jgi:hypothetical protein
MVLVCLTSFMEHSNGLMLDFFECALYSKSKNQVTWIWK